MDIGRQATATFIELHKEFGDAVMNERTCNCWYKDIQNGLDSCELDGGQGAPVSALTEETINTGAVMICTDPHLTVGQLAFMLDKSIRNVHLLFHNRLKRFTCLRLLNSMFVNTSTETEPS